MCSMSTLAMEQTKVIVSPNDSSTISLTCSCEILHSCILCRTMVHHTALGKQCNCVKQLVDGIAWLMDGHHNNAIVGSGEADRESEGHLILTCTITARFQCIRSV